MREVISNTSPLQYLHRLGFLSWLRDFYGKIIVPAAVADELEAGMRLGANVPNLAELDWIEIRQENPAKQQFPNHLHAGEAAVLGLAMAAADALVLIDDEAARKTARQMQISVTGTLGILLRGKREGLLSSVGGELARLELAGFWVAPSTLAHVLKLAGE